MASIALSSHAVSPAPNPSKIFMWYRSAPGATPTLFPAATPEQCVPCELSSFDRTSSSGSGASDQPQGTEYAHSSSSVNDATWAAKGCFDVTSNSESLGDEFFSEEASSFRDLEERCSLVPTYQL